VEGVKKLSGDREHFSSGLKMSVFPNERFDSDAGAAAQGEYQLQK